MSNYDTILAQIDELGEAILAREKLLSDLACFASRVKAKYADLDLVLEKSESDSRKLEIADKLALLKGALDLGLTEEGVFKLFYSVFPPYSVAAKNTNTILEACRQILPNIIGSSSYPPYPEEVEDVIDPEEDDDDSGSSL